MSLKRISVNEDIARNGGNKIEVVGMLLQKQLDLLSGWRHKTVNGVFMISNLN